MSSITKPPMLDSTGRDIRDELKRQNGYLAMLAESRRSEVYTSMSQIASIIRGGDVEQNAKLMPIGDQIIMPWKDMDDSAHNTDETAYQVPWDIVRHGLVTLRDGSVVPGMFLQMHLCSAYGVQFSHQQAFMMCPDGLAAGAYTVTFGATWGSKGANAGTSWTFELSQEVPAGGMLSGFEGLPDVDPSAFKVKSWASADAVEPIETVSVTAGASGTSLGTMNLTTRSDDGLNCMQRVGYGHNRWDTSAIRRYLNSAGANWWKPQEDFDVRPDQYAKQGFLSGFGEDFLSAIKPVKVTTALNTVEGHTETTVDTYDTFFLPSLEQMNVKPQLDGVEGTVSRYWRERMGLDQFLNYQWESAPNQNEGLKIPAINSASPQDVRLRSAYRGNANNTWHVHSSGFAHTSYPNMSHRVVKDCFHKVIDGWTYRQAVCILDGQYDQEIGYNPGSQMIQIAGIGILNALDHYVKEVLRVQFYIRYMDDFILIHHDRDYLLECKVKIAQMLLGLECRFNTKKTGISPLTDGILFLGFQYRMTRTGKVIMTLNSDNVRHERKKLRKLVHLAKKGERMREKVDECYASWKNHAAKGNSYKLLQRMDEYYKKLWQEDFPDEPSAKRKGDERK